MFDTDSHGGDTTCAPHTSCRPPFHAHPTGRASGFHTTPEILRSTSDWIIKHPLDMPENRGSVLAADVLSPVGCEGQLPIIDAGLICWVELGFKTCRSSVDPLKLRHCLCHNVTEGVLLPWGGWPCLKQCLGGFHGSSNICQAWTSILQ